MKKFFVCLFVAKTSFELLIYPHLRSKNSPKKQKKKLGRGRENLLTTFFSLVRISVVQWKSLRFVMIV